MITAMNSQRGKNRSEDAVKTPGQFFETALFIESSASNEVHLMDGALKITPEQLFIDP